MMMVPRSFAQRRDSREEPKMDEKRHGIAVGWHAPRPHSAPAVETPDVGQKEAKTIADDAARPLPRRTTTPTPTPTRTAAQPVSVPSKPVVIPSRNERRNRPETSQPRPAHVGRRTTSRSFDERHNPRSVPPSVAALLAVTSIPRPNPNASQRRRANGAKPFQKTSIDELIQVWREEEATSPSVSPGSRSHMEILLERSDEADAECASDVSPSYVDSSSDFEGKGSLTSRSTSSDSVGSIPDLVLDEDRSPPGWPSPTTPSPKARRPTAEKVSSFTEECPLDHPLLHPTRDVGDDDASPLVESADLNASLATPRARPLRQRPPRSSFKSNLTAGFNALASSLRSFSNFTAPSIPPDDMLTRSIFSPTLPHQYSPEMRPKSSDGVPDPALRRYLNPTPRPERLRQQHQRRLSLEERDRDFVAPGGRLAALGVVGSGLEPDFAAAVNATSSLTAALELEGPMIQLQTYGPRGAAANSGSGSSSSSNRAANRNKKLPPLPRNPNSEFGRAAANAAAAAASSEAASSLRQREPRENSDFLRVIVLEMNMRRGGKLDARGVSRAKVWLPPRKGGPHLAAVSHRDEGDEEGVVSSSSSSSPPSSSSSSSVVVGEKRVPARWIGVLVDDA